jgi:hypothetical protein
LLRAKPRNPRGGTGKSKVLGFLPGWRVDLFLLYELLLNFAGKVLLNCAGIVLLYFAGYEFVVLTVTTCGSLGMYLAFYGTGLRHNILAGLLSILVGLLVFRMLFPIRPEAKPVQKT